MEDVGQSELNVHHGCLECRVNSMMLEVMLEMDDGVLSHSQTPFETEYIPPRR